MQKLYYLLQRGNKYGQIQFLASKFKVSDKAFNIIALWVIQNARQREKVLNAIDGILNVLGD